MNEQYHANMNRERIHRSQIHMKPLGITKSDIMLKKWNFSEEFLLELRKNV